LIFLGLFWRIKKYEGRKEHLPSTFFEVLEPSKKLICKRGLNRRFEKAIEDEIAQAGGFF